jgi:hypothetical protein
MYNEAFSVLNLLIEWRINDEGMVIHVYIVSIVKCGAATWRTMHFSPSM